MPDFFVDALGNSDLVVRSCSVFVGLTVVEHSCSVHCSASAGGVEEEGNTFRALLEPRTCSDYSEISLVN